MFDFKKFSFVKIFDIFYKRKKNDPTEYKYFTFLHDCYKEIRLNVQKISVFYSSND